MKQRSEWTDLERAYANNRDLYLKHSKKTAKYKEKMEEASRGLLAEQLGLVIGETYSFIHKGKTLTGTFLDIVIKVGVPTMKMDVNFKNRTVIWYVAPNQLIGYESIPEEKIRWIFTIFDNASKRPVY